VGTSASAAESRQSALFPSQPQSWFFRNLGVASLGAANRRATVQKGSFPGEPAILLLESIQGIRLNPVEETVPVNRHPGLNRAAYAKRRQESESCMPSEPGEQAKFEGIGAVGSSRNAV